MGLKIGQPDLSVAAEKLLGYPDFPSFGFFRCQVGIADKLSVKIAVQLKKSRVLTPVP